MNYFFTDSLRRLKALLTRRPCYAGHGERLLNTSPRPAPRPAFYGLGVHAVRPIRLRYRLAYKNKQTGMIKRGPAAFNNSVIATKYMRHMRTAQPQYKHWVEPVVDTRNLSDRGIG